MRLLPDIAPGFCWMWLLVSGCVISAQPSPPSLDITSVDSDDSVGATDNAEVVLLGRPGAVDPGGGVIVLTPLESDFPERPQVSAVAADGSFAILSPVGVVRLQVRQDPVRSVPTDLAVDRDSLTPYVGPYDGCLSMARELTIDDIAIGEQGPVPISVSNRCGEALQLSVRLRSTAGAFTLSSAPASINAGETVTVLLTAAPTATDIEENTLIVSVTGPQIDLRATTLFVAGAAR